ncbi:secretory pathway Sec39 [Saccharata proteae CBS 121410]|uniref:Secretory pathway Sec39 n=1 Tax=Saccharata proteae CBS 121410 TaxID=1314787 RepID=A0A9P4I353_9PEZI|nr:secretory pathway Sec39 [Saccharata proteae CBS 121410]
MADLRSLSQAHCVLLATHYAADSNVSALRALSLERPDAFVPELLLRILLTFLPESTEPSAYSSYALEAATRLYLEQHEQSSVEVTPVKDLSEQKASRRVGKLELLPLVCPSRPYDDGEDPFIIFLIHRAHRIDAQTGLLDLVPQLVAPFLDRSEYLRTWFISNILPLVRVDFEYYPENEATTSLEKFEQIEGLNGVELLLSRTIGVKDGPGGAVETVARDIKGVIGPWMYGCYQRKRRKLDGSIEDTSTDLDGQSDKHNSTNENHDWEYIYTWLARLAANDFELASGAIEHWDGPSDVDLGGYEATHGYLSEDLLRHLERRYSQAAFACVYSAEDDSRETVEAAHSVLVRLAELLDFEPPPNLATSVEMLPKISKQTDILQGTTTAVLQPDLLLKPDHPLTVPTIETFSLLQIFVYSAYILADLGHPISLSNLAKFRFQADEEDQEALLKKILYTQKTSPTKDKEQWRVVRSRLIWLWDWGMDPNEQHAMTGPGVLGKIGRYTYEKEILTGFLTASQYDLAIEIYLPVDGVGDHLQDDDIVACVIDLAMHYYDTASNGNVTRGSMKKALELVSEFQPYFSDSSTFLRTEALIAATHSLSFYSLTLQHGVPFKPVNIRVSKDPIALIGKVLDQNLRSYTKLDDLITIAQNLVASGVADSDGPWIDLSPTELGEERMAAGRRVIGMAIEAALAEDDFETAYSFVVNRLNSDFDATAAPNSRPGTGTGHLEPQKRNEEDVSWRAAYLAGRHRSPNNSLSSSRASLAAGSSPVLRRLEQRMELLSQALLLAPQSALPEVLTAWRRCEEELTALLAQETAAEERHNDRADHKIPGAFLNSTPTVQPRREVGRGAAEEAPMGLFDVARGAAAAFSRSAFPLRSGSAAESGGRISEERMRTDSTAGSETGSMTGSVTDAEGRARKRDMVANAVTGGLASGLGWVLGATPVQNQQRE